MAILIEVSVPPAAFVLGCVFEDHPDVEIELERVVPAEKDILPYVWFATDEDVAAVVTTIRKQTETKSLTKLTDVGGRALYEVAWEPSVDRVMTALREDHCGCIQVTGTKDGWSLHLRFQDHGNVLAFKKTLTDEGVPVTLERLCEYSEFLRPSGAAMSPKQQSAVQLAHQEGYFEVPRKCTIDDLADEAGLSTSAFSERLRRGIDCLAAETDTDRPRRDP